MNHEYEQNRASSRDATTGHEYGYAFEPGQLSRSALLRKPENLMASGLVQRKESATAPGELATSRTVSPEPTPLPALTRSGLRTTLQMLFGVQRAATAAPAEDSAQVHAAAARGTATPASKLPYVNQIQRAFGRHDISRIQAHIGPDAAASACEMGAWAYATGDHVVLSQGVDLHTVAHEAAHVVQQRGGVHLKGGVGQAGDTHEQHADAVADRVVAGQSATGLLDEYAQSGVGSPGGNVQMVSSVAFSDHKSGHAVVQRKEGDQEPGTGSPPASTLPHPLSGSVGTVGYYAARNADFKSRYPTPPPAPPTYYMSYGDKYAHRFTTVLWPKLSAKGQAWIWKTFRLLQMAIEDRLSANPAAFDALEKDDAAFQKFAYDTHPKAYLDGGLHELPVADLARIVATPQGDIMTLDGISQILKTAGGIVPQWVGDAKDATVEGAKAVGHKAGKIWDLVTSQF